MAHGRKARRFEFEVEENFEGACRWLQEKLGHASTTLPDEPVKRVRVPEEWLRSGDGCLTRVDLDPDETDIDELPIAITLRDGRCYVGVVAQQHPGSIILRLWGGTAIRIGFRSIRVANLIGRHTAAEMRTVCCRQRCHEPAATFADKTIDSKMGISSPTT